MAYVDGHKTDANDALTVVNAAIQIGIKYSKRKSMEQHIRGIINEYVIVKAKGTKGLTALVTSTLHESDVMPESLVKTLSMPWLQYLDAMAYIY
nr:hypothetical protein [uncultured Vibrio sp.]